MRRVFPFHVDCAEILNFKAAAEQRRQLFLGGKIEDRTDGRLAVFPLPAELGAVFAEANREVAPSRREKEYERTDEAILAPRRYGHRPAPDTLGLQG